PVALLLAAFDSMLHRELGHRQFISEHRGYEARLIGWVEVVGQGSGWEEAALVAANKRNARQQRQPDDSTAGVEAMAEQLGIKGDRAGARALSIRQPHAEAILRGVKQIEYRSAPTHIRGRILIYAALGRYPEAEEVEMMQGYGIKDVTCDDLARGVLVGS